MGVHWPYVLLSHNQHAAEMRAVCLFQSNLASSLNLFTCLYPRLCTICWPAPLPRATRIHPCARASASLHLPISLPPAPHTRSHAHPHTPNPPPLCPNLFICLYPRLCTMFWPAPLPRATHINPCARASAPLPLPLPLPPAPHTRPHSSHLCPHTSTSSPSFVPQERLLVRHQWPGAAVGAACSRQQRSPGGPRPSVRHPLQHHLRTLNRTLNRTNINILAEDSFAEGHAAATAAVPLGSCSTPWSTPWLLLMRIATGTTSPADRKQDV